jgi:DUF971 family protein
MAGPQPRVIRRSLPARVEIEWDDGTATSLSAAELRRLCPCATCVDEMSGIRTLDPTSIADDMTQTDVRLVGNYAICVAFSDGHHTGIFTWDLLHSWASAS